MTGTNFAHFLRVLVRKFILFFAFIGFALPMYGYDFADGCRFEYLANVKAISESSRGGLNSESSKEKEDQNLDYAVLSDDQELHSKNRLKPNLVRDNGQLLNPYMERYEAFLLIQQALQKIAHSEFLTSREDYDQIIASAEKYLPRGEELNRENINRSWLVLDAMAVLERGRGQGLPPLTGKELLLARKIWQRTLDKLPRLARDERVPEFMRQYLRGLPTYPDRYDSGSLNAVQNLVNQIEDLFLSNVREE